MIRNKVKIINKLGLHARAAAKFVTLASGYKSDVQLVKGERGVNGKSIMGVMMLAAACGSELELVIDGADEQEAMAKLEELINALFGEAE
jgi:phosphocarrier protein